ncbi:MAG: TlpA family protein disulfide reductase [Solirubrobacteraceae bacterium]
MARRVRVLAGTLVVIAALVAVAVLGLSSHKSSGRRAPALPRETLRGGQVTLGSLLADARGKPALVVFWASWCGPCAQEAPALERFSETAVGRGRIVGVDWSDARSGAVRFLRRYAWTFPNLRDADGLVGSSYGLTGLPTTFVVGADGLVDAALRGPQSERSLRRALAAAEGS